jgi:CTP:molybdopterin cytidylyltransferase MocA
MAQRGEVDFREREPADDSEVNSNTSPAAIILAAGASSRMGRVKALLEIDSETFVDRLVRVLGEHCSPVIVVLGHHADAIQKGVRVDIPLASAATVGLLAKALTDGAAVAVPTYGGKRGHPVAISRGVAERLLALPQGARANDLIRQEAAVEIAVDDAGVLVEVDTPNDYQELLCRVG